MGANGSGTIDNVSIGTVLTTDCTGAQRDPQSLLTFSPGDCARLPVIYAPADATAPAGYIDFLSDDPTNPEVKVPVSLGPPATLNICTLKADGGVAAPATRADGKYAAHARLRRPPHKGTIVTKKLRLSNVGTIGISRPLARSAGWREPTRVASGLTQAAAATSDRASAPASISPFTFDPSQSSGWRSAMLSIDSNDSTREPIVVFPSRPRRGAGVSARARRPSSSGWSARRARP